MDRVNASTHDIEVINRDGVRMWINWDLVEPARKEIQKLIGGEDSEHPSDDRYKDTMNERSVVLPDRNEMQKRIAKACSIYHMREKLGSILLKAAGESHNALSIALLFIDSVTEYTRDMPMLEGMVYRLVPNLIDAIVDDKHIAEEAKKVFSDRQE